MLWVRVRDAVAGALDSMTLADLVPPRIAPPDSHPARPPLQGALTRLVTDTEPPRPTSTSSSAACASRRSPAPSTEILQGIDLTVGKGEVHAIMGPNGSGKTTLAYALMGHPAYVVNGGEVIWKGRDILKLVARQARPARACSSPSSTRPRSPA